MSRDIDAGPLESGFPHATTVLIDPDTGQMTREGLRFWQLVWQRTGGGYDQIYDLETLAANIEQLALLRRDIDSAQQDIEALRASVETAQLRKILRDDIIKGEVITAAIAQNAVTNADSTTDTGSRVSASFTEFELVRHTQTLTANTTAIIQIFMNATDVLASMGFTISVGSGNRDIYLRLLRDPDGTPVELFKVFLKENQGAGPSSYTVDAYSAIYEDTTHGGGETTYAWVVTSYTAGTTTLNSSTLDHTDITRTLYCLEAKR